MPKSRERSEAALYVVQNPPGCIADLETTPVVRAGENSDHARFGLGCKKCSATEFRIYCDPYVVTSERRFNDFPLGYAVELSPIRVECASCGVRRLVFDATKHGYDGAYAGAEYLTRGDGIEKPIACEQLSYHVEVAFAYHTEFEELQSVEAEIGVKVQDLFDWFVICAVGSDGTILKALDYECA